jgi:DNA-binding response OmpR family regulator
VKAHILIVDDDPFMAKLLTFVLSDNGYQASMLPDPGAVLPFLAAHPVDLILLDVVLPQTDGLPLRAAIQRAHPDLPVISLPHHALPIPVRRVGGPATDEVVGEPFEPMELLLRVRAILGGCSPRRRADGGRAHPVDRPSPGAPHRSDPTIER